MKTLNTVLCLLCIATVAAIILNHVRETKASPMNEVAGYFGGGSEWSTPAISRTTTEMPGNPFAPGGGSGVDASATLSVTERQQGAQRWHELRDLAAKAAAEPQPTANAWRARRAAAARSKVPYRRTTEGQIRANRQHRRTKTLFERSRHYNRYKQSYRNPDNTRRRGLTGNRAARSRYQ